MSRSCYATGIKDTLEKGKMAMPRIAHARPREVESG